MSGRGSTLALSAIALVALCACAIGMPPIPSWEGRDSSAFRVYIVNVVIDSEFASLGDRSAHEPKLVADGKELGLLKVGHYLVVESSSSEMVLQFRTGRETSIVKVARGDGPDQILEYQNAPFGIHHTGIHPPAAILIQRNPDDWFFVKFRRLIGRDPIRQSPIVRNGNGEGPLAQAKPAPPGLKISTESVPKGP